MAPILYFAAASPPARFVLLTARSLGIDIKIQLLNLMAKEQLNDDFIKLNPAHQVPLLIDDGFVVSESRAIAAYLVNSKKPGHSLYPSDPKARALVDSRLYYDASVVFQKNCEAYRPVLHAGQTSIPAEKRAAVQDYMKVLEAFLDGQKWFAGDEVTIADLSILANIASIKNVGYDISEHKKVSNWYENCKSLPGFQENEDGSNVLAKLIKDKLQTPFH